MSERWSDDTKVLQPTFCFNFLPSLSDAIGLVNLRYANHGRVMLFLLFMSTITFFRFFIFCVCFIRRQGASVTFVGALCSELVVE